MQHLDDLYCAARAAFHSPCKGTWKARKQMAHMHLRQNFQSSHISCSHFLCQCILKNPRWLKLSWSLPTMAHFVAHMLLQDIKPHIDHITLSDALPMQCTTLCACPSCRGTTTYLLLVLSFLFHDLDCRSTHFKAGHFFALPGTSPLHLSLFFSSPSKQSLYLRCLLNSVRMTYNEPASEASFCAWCMTGYKSCKKKLSLFGVPKEDIVFQQWQRNMQRVDKPLERNVAVCELHFDQ